jgi:hypothetical protein
MENVRLDGVGDQLLERLEGRLPADDLGLLLRIATSLAPRPHGGGTPVKKPRSLVVAFKGSQAA